MAILIPLKKDGTETGGTAADKINAGLAKTDANETAIADKVDKVAGKGLSTKDFTDTEKAKLGFIGITQAINLDEAILEGDRASKTDLTDVTPGPAVLKRFVDNGGLRHILQLMNAPRETYELIGANPTMKMKVDATGHAAQMQVINNGHDVATMEWLKDTQEFVFQLADKDSGVTRATFEIKPDGHAYIGGKQVATDVGAMVDRGVITDIDTITKTGIYHGTNVANSPVTGPVMVMTSKDAAGNLGFFIMGQDQLLRTGGKPVGGTVDWKSISYIKDYDLEIGPGKEYPTLQEAVDYVTAVGVGNFKMTLFGTGEHELSGKWAIDGNVTIALSSHDSHTHSKLKLMTDHSVIMLTNGAIFTCKNIDITNPTTSLRGCFTAANGCSLTLHNCNITLTTNQPLIVSQSSILIMMGKCHFETSGANIHTRAFIRLVEDSRLIGSNETDTRFIYTGTPILGAIHLDSNSHADFYYLRNAKFTVENLKNVISFTGNNSSIMLPAVVVTGPTVPTRLISIFDHAYTNNKIHYNVTTIDSKITSIGERDDGVYSDGYIQVGTVSTARGDLLVTRSYFDANVEKMIREFRSTIQHTIADYAKPTRAECIDAFKHLPHFDWTKDDDFYIQDTSGSKLVLIKYRAGSATDEATAGTFHYEILSTAK